MSALADLPVVPLSALDGGAATQLLAPTARLANALRLAHGAAQQSRGVQVWQALNGATPAQWLDRLCSAALLAGELPPEAVPAGFLTRPQERCLWQRVVAQDMAEQGGELFDVAGMALAAAEAETLLTHWRLDAGGAGHEHSDEFRAFARWRTRVAEICRHEGWLGAAQAMQWRIDAVARGIGGLPARVALAGFTDADPPLMRLLAALAQRGVDVVVVAPAGGAGKVDARACADAADECAAAANWVAERLRANPAARLRIACADWPARRPKLEAALAAALQPHAVGAGWVAQPAPWRVVGGTPLVDEYLVDLALRLLQLAARPRELRFADLSALLREPGWSADVAEMDARARLEAALREMLAPETSLARAIHCARRLASADFPHLSAHLDVLADAWRGESSRRVPGEWGCAFVALLERLGWPGQRRLMSAELAACQRMREALLGLMALDAVSGRVDVATALRLARSALRDLSFQPPNPTAAVDIGALADALGTPVDGLWLLGMNEGVWPPLPRPNPLLPAPWQRRAGIPGARADLLADAARAQQAQWCAQAGEIVFSWAQRDGERALRISPLLDGLPESTPMASPVPAPRTMPHDALETLVDSQAPAMTAEELARIRGGTALLGAQAVCPAWGFYQYRLGAAVLPAPTFGLDARVRGGLLHAALEAFWGGRGLADLRRLDAHQRREEVALAVDVALAGFQRRASEPLTPRQSALERTRLCALLGIWLDVEAGRADFVVEACEERHELRIAGLPVTVIIDRIDRLADGRLAIIDYKSGRSAGADSWSETRIVEPQLPIYAALALPDADVAAVALARVVMDVPGFVGVAATDGLLPAVKSLDEQRRRYDADDFPDWSSLRRLWGERIEQLAREIVAGEAAARFDADDIVWCPVQPLLRAAERRALFEAAQRQVLQYES